MSRSKSKRGGAKRRPAHAKHHAHAKPAKKRSNPAPSRAHAHAHHATHGHHAPAKPRARRHASLAEAGIVIVPASAVAKKNPARKRHHTHHRRPKKKNPAGFGEIALQAAKAVGFGALAAGVGMASSSVLYKLKLQGKYANAASNAAMGALTGGLVSLLSPAAGTVVSHQYMVAAIQWLTAPEAPATASRALPSGPRTMGLRTAAGPGVTGAPANALRARGGLAGVEEMGAEFDGVAADVGAPDEMQGFEHLQGIAADVGAFAPLEGITADVGGIEPLQGDDYGDPDVFGDAEGYGDIDVGDEYA